MMKASVDLSQLLYLYNLLLHTRLDSHPLDILKFLVTTLRNQDNKFAFIRVNEDGALARSSEFMKTFHIMNIIVQNTGVYTSSLNGKSKIPNNTLANITRYFSLYSIHKKELWCFVYQYAVWLSRKNRE